MLTTKDKREDLLEGFEAGIDAYVDKIINEVSSDHPEQEKLDFIVEEMPEV